MTISTNLLDIRGVFGEEGDAATSGLSPPKFVGVLKELLTKPAEAIKKLAGKVVEDLPTITGSVVGAILSFLVKTVRFVAVSTWSLIVFVAEFIGVWLM